MGNDSPKRKRVIDTFAARDLHSYDRKDTSVNAFIKYGIYSNYNIKALERRQEEVFGVSASQNLNNQ